MGNEQLEVMLILAGSGLAKRQLLIASPSCGTAPEKLQGLYPSVPEARGITAASGLALGAAAGAGTTVGLSP